MPRIVMKRSDIEAGLLQVPDLMPNESQRNPPYQPVGQSKYIRAVQNETVVTSGSAPIIMGGNTRGLGAWLICNVENATLVQATGTITVTAAAAGAGDTITIGGTVLTAVAGARTPGSDDFSLASGTDAGVATSIADAINDALNSFTAIVTATDLAGVVTLTAVPIGVLGNAITLATDNAPAYALSGANLTGGVTDDAITAANVNTISADILTNLVRFGNTGAAAVAATLAAINTRIQATVATAAMTAGQLPDVLDILAGREYLAPAGCQIQNAAGRFDPQAGANGAAAFVSGTLRDVFTTSSLRISASGGMLSGYLSNTFHYGTATGTNLEAVVIYNDDGSLYTP